MTKTALWIISRQQLSDNKMMAGALSPGTVKGATKMFYDNADFYPTPEALADYMVNMADLKRVRFVLEPSAGKGDLVKALKNKMVRQALALAIDRNFISDNVLKGQIPAGAFVPPAIKGIKQSFRLESSNYIDLDNYENNIIKAKELMAKAGYKNGENYPTLEMKVSPGTFYELGKAIQTMWKDNLNVNVNLVEEEFPVTLIALTKKKYQIARMGWTGDYYDPMTMLDVMLSYGGVNHSGFSNAQYDSLISEAKTAYYNNLRIEYMKKAEAILMDEMPIIPLYYKSNYLMVNPKLKDFVINSIGRYRFNYCYIEK